MLLVWYGCFLGDDGLFWKDCAHVTHGDCHVSLAFTAKRLFIARESHFDKPSSFVNEFAAHLNLFSQSGHFLCLFIFGASGAARREGVPSGPDPPPPAVASPGSSHAGRGDPGTTRWRRVSGRQKRKTLTASYFLSTLQHVSTTRKDRRGRRVTLSDDGLSRGSDAHAEGATLDR